MTREELLSELRRVAESNPAMKPELVEIERKVQGGVKSVVEIAAALRELENREPALRNIRYKL